MGQQAALKVSDSPVSGEIYRTSDDESLLVLGVKPGRVFVECADGSFRHFTDQEWHRLSPNPARC